MTKMFATFNSKIFYFVYLKPVYLLHCFLAPNESGMGWCTWRACGK
jgi:hypothetical protein